MNTSLIAHHRADQLSYSPWSNRTHTATIDWCEANYQESDYIAESWNSWSNVPFIIIALWGVRSVSKLEELPNRLRYILVHLGIAVIGVGSFIFHATLNWHAQVLLDEMPMIYVSVQALYCILSEGRPASYALKMTCISIPLLITAVYISWPNPTFHQFCYGTLQLYMAYRVHGLLSRLPAPQQPIPLTFRSFSSAPFSAASAWFNKSQIKTEKKQGLPTTSGQLRADAERLLASGLLLMITAFGFWNVDNIFCDHLTVWRQKRENDAYWLVNGLTQGHATWHVLTSIGINRALTAIVGITIGLQDPDAVEFAWKWKFLPYVRSTNSYKTILKAKADNVD